MNKGLCKDMTFRKGIPALLIFLGSLGFFMVPRVLYAKTAAEVLKTYKRLSEKERDNQLVEGAKREGKLVFYGVTTVYQMVKSGLADPYLSPSRKGIMPEFMDKDGYWTAIYHLVVALGYNTDHVKKEELPKNYDGLLDPKWKGRMSLDQTDMHLMGTLLEYWGRDKALAYFRKLAANEPMLRRGRRLQAQILGGGEVHIAPWLYGYRPGTMKRQGAPVDTTLLEPILTVPTYLMLAKNSPHPHAAALFIDWALSRDG